MSTPGTILVVTMTFNQPGPWIRQCLGSVETQDCPHVHVVGDDGSTRPDTLEALGAFGDRVRFRPHVGPGKGAMNEVILSGPETDYIAVLDADDVMMPGRLLRQRDYLDRHPTVDLVTGGSYAIDRDGRDLGRRWLYGGPYEATRPPPARPSDRSAYRPPCHSACMYRRSAWERAGRYPGSHPGDAYLFEAMVRGGSLFTVLNEALILRRVWEGSLWWDVGSGVAKRRLLKREGRL